MAGLIDLSARPGGLIHSLETIEVPSDLPAVTVFCAVGPRLEIGARPLTGTAASLDPSDARLRAAVELHERYSMLVVEPEALKFGTRGRVPGALSLARFLPATEEEYGGFPDDVQLRHPTDDDAIRWSGAMELHTGRPLLLPAVCVFSSLKPLPTESLWRCSSNGCAAHTSSRSATASAILELIEREAATVSWLWAWPGRKLDLRDLRSSLPETAPLLDRIADSSLAVQVFDLSTSLGVPTVYAIGERRTNGRVTVAGASGFDISRIVNRALLEVVQVHLAIEGTEITELVAQRHQLLEYGAYMADPIRRAAFSFLLDAEVVPSGVEQLCLNAEKFETHEDDFAHVREQLSASGVDVYLVNLTTDELADVGLECVRAVAPGMQAITFSHRVTLANRERAEALLGHSLRHSQLNAWPNPFA